MAHKVRKNFFLEQFMQKNIVTEENGITIKGSNDGLVLIIPSEPSLEEIFAQLREKFSTAPAFFQNGEFLVDVGLRPFQEEEFQTFCSLFSSAGIRLNGIVSDNPITKLLAQGEGISLVGDRSIINSRIRMDHPVRKERLQGKDATRTLLRRETRSSSREPALFVKKTIRGGQKLHFAGNMTIVGDVNPGAEVVSTGNILVFGSLRGLAHAGAEGSKDAIVAALELRPTQLRIADCIARAPKSSQDFLRGPEVARIQDGQIIIESYQK